LGRYGENLLQGTAETREIVLEEYLAEIETVSKMLVNNTEGVTAVYYRFNPELFAPTAGFYNVKTAGEEFEKLLTTDLSLYEEVQVPWYYEPVNAGAAVWLNQYTDKNTGIDMISYASPVFYNGKNIGVLGMDVEIYSWKTMIEQISLYESGFAFLMDREENIIYHPEYKNGIAAEEVPEIVNIVKLCLEESVQERKSHDYTLDAQERVMVASRLDNDMIFGVVVPLKEISEPSRFIMVDTILLAVGIVVVFCLFSVRICKKIIGMAYNDVMTGTKNKTAYEEVVETISQEIRDKVAKFALVMFDINNLKITNDTYGHDQGDILIVTAAKLMQQVFGENNVFRVGGDEFVVLLCHEKADSYQERLQDFADRLNKLNEEKQFVWGDIKVASGATLYDFRTDAAYGDVFRRVDALMYQNKKKLKNL